MFCNILNCIALSPDIGCYRSCNTLHTCLATCHKGILHSWEYIALVCDSCNIIHSCNIPFLWHFYQSCIPYVLDTCSKIKASVFPIQSAISCSQMTREKYNLYFSVVRLRSREYFLKIPAKM